MLHKYIEWVIIPIGYHSTYHIPTTYMFLLHTIRLPNSNIEKLNLDYYFLFFFLLKAEANFLFYHRLEVVKTDKPKRKSEH